MKRLVKIIGFGVLCSGLTACANTHFDCPNHAVARCESLDQINSQVDSGQLCGWHKRSLACATARVTCAADAKPFSPPVSASPAREDEAVQRVWVAPYEDNEGNYHEASAMWVVMKGGHWVEKQHV